MKTSLPTVAIALVCSAFSIGCNLPQFSAKQDFQKVIPINSQVDVHVQTFNGSITVTPSDQSEISLVAHIKASGYSQEEAEAALDSLVPEIDTTTSAITIACKKRNQVLNFSDSVSLELKVPASWPMHLVTSNGSVTTTQSRGPVSIESSNGQIHVKEAVGNLKLATSNGKVTVENSVGNVQASTSNGVVQLVGCSLEGKCKLDTSNGAISVSFIDRSPVQVDARTSNGAIKFNESDIFLTKKSKSHISGVLFGKASDANKVPSLELDTSNGSITIETQSTPKAAAPTSEASTSNSN